MEQSKSFILVLTLVAATTFVASAQIDCFRNKHVSITRGKKIKVVYCPPDTSFVSDAMRRITSRQPHLLLKPVHGYLGGDIRYSLKGRFEKSVSDSVFILMVKGKEQLLDVRYVFSIEPKSVWKSALAGVFAFYLLSVGATAMNDIQTGRSNRLSTASPQVLFTASAGAIYAVFNSRLFFPPYRIDRGWRFKLQPPMTK